MNEDERSLLTAAITSGVRAPMDAIERLGNNRTFHIMAAAMSIAIERGFADGTTPAQIQNYVEDLLERFPKADGEIKASALEAVIRAGLGEPELIEPLTYDDLLGASYLLTFDLISQQELDDAGREEYFQTVIALADEES
ncbi:hypothetical protein [Phytomonospora endophytica]|uniref:Uncharacterized protein n=1 Tax=Phytomonospora endophytica TaxID=714109 RepID=A0A841FMF1_9ACTN|nr:hypothetical protein [Phytomonospora endophytica]MBB6037034.1 hypothetical protein [Phytomonospora endophytica]GIG69422.1 hypothetical protein Pen01_57170 [Phytomonospora endophytica]